ncbi:hypothetical protein [Pseudomonas viridiflava]|nr:hypothetical protein [Pseudomonas viridiflava]MBI6723068.1 hypothetical protein [Pseudomonas viridiflava]
MLHIIVASGTINASVLPICKVREPAQARWVEARALSSIISFIFRK